MLARRLARLRTSLPSNAALLGLAFGIALQLSVAGIVASVWGGGLSDRPPAASLALPG